MVLFLFFFNLDLESVFKKCDFCKTAEELVKFYSDSLDLPKLSSDIFTDLTSTQPFSFLELQPPYLKCAKEDLDISRDSRWGSEIKRN